MNKVALQISKQIGQESEKIISYLANIEELCKSGEVNAVDSVKLFEDLAIDGVEHLQRLVVALTDCFFQKEDEKK